MAKRGSLLGVEWRFIEEAGKAGVKPRKPDTATSASSADDDDHTVVPPELVDLLQRARVARGSEQPASTPEVPKQPLDQALLPTNELLEVIMKELDELEGPSAVLRASAKAALATPPRTSPVSRSRLTVSSARETTASAGDPAVDFEEAPIGRERVRVRCDSVPAPTHRPMVFCACWSLQFGSRTMVPCRRSCP